MNRGSTLFLKIVIILIGIGALAWMVWFPQVDGRNANSDHISIYFNDPFLVYAYIASIPFFGVLYQACKLLGLVDKNKIFSQVAVKAVRNIKYCATALVTFIVGAEVYLFIAIRGTDDIAGGVAMGLFIIFFSLIVVATADVFEGLLQKAVNK